MRQNIRSIALKMGKKAGLTGAALLAFVNQAMAAVPANISTAITDAGADGATVAGLVLVAVVGIFAFVLMRKGLR